LILDYAFYVMNGVILVEFKIFFFFPSCELEWHET